MENFPWIAALCGALSALSVVFFAKRVRRLTLPLGLDQSDIIRIFGIVPLCFVIAYVHFNNSTSGEINTIVVASLAACINIVAGIFGSRDLMPRYKLILYGLVMFLYVIAVGIVLYLQLIVWHFIALYASMNLVILAMSVRQNGTLTSAEFIEHCDEEKIT